MSVEDFLIIKFIITSVTTGNIGHKFNWIQIKILNGMNINKMYLKVEKDVTFIVSEAEYNRRNFGRESSCIIKTLQIIILKLVLCHL